MEILSQLSLVSILLLILVSFAKKIFWYRLTELNFCCRLCGRNWCSAYPWVCSL